MSDELYIELLVGLPYSGKTTYANKKFYTDEKYGVINLDESFSNYDKNIKANNPDTEKEFKNDILRLVGNCMDYNTDIIIVDSPATTNESIIKVLSAISEGFCKLDITIRAWENNPDYCIKHIPQNKNNIEIENMIRNFVYEGINVEKINNELKKFNSRVVKVISQKI